MRPSNASHPPKVVRFFKRRFISDVPNSGKGLKPKNAWIMEEKAFRADLWAACRDARRRETVASASCPRGVSSVVLPLQYFPPKMESNTSSFDLPFRLPCFVPYQSHNPSFQLSLLVICQMDCTPCSGNGFVTDLLRSRTGPVCPGLGIMQKSTRERE